MTYRISPYDSLEREKDRLACELRLANQRLSELAGEREGLEQRLRYRALLWGQVKYAGRQVFRVIAALAIAFVFATCASQAGRAIGRMARDSICVGP